MAHLDLEQAHHLYDMLMRYKHDEVESVSLQVFEGNDCSLPLHWRDEYQFEIVYHVIDRLAHENSESVFIDIAVNGHVPGGMLLEAENELLGDEEAMELECYLLHDFLSCFEASDEQADRLHHIGFG